MSFRGFQICFNCGHLGYCNEAIIATTNQAGWMPPPNFQYNLTFGSEGEIICIVSNGNNGGNLGYRNINILALLNIHLALMPPNKSWFNPTYDMEVLCEEFKDTYFVIYGIISEFTDKGQFQYLTNLKGPQEGTYLYTTQILSLG